MGQYVIKVLVTAVLVVAISEVAKRWTLMGAIIASLPLTSVLAMVWLYLDTGSKSEVISLSQAIFWIVIPSLVFFLLLPVFLRQGWNFWVSMVSASLCTAAAYWGYVQLLGRVGIKI